MTSGSAAALSDATEVPSSCELWVLDATRLLHHCRGSMAATCVSHPQPSSPLLPCITFPAHHRTSLLSRVSRRCCPGIPLGISREAHGLIHRADWCQWQCRTFPINTAKYGAKARMTAASARMYSNSRLETTTLEMGGQVSHVSQAGRQNAA